MRGRGLLKWLLCVGVLLSIAGACPAAEAAGMKPVFTEEEQAFIAESGVIKVGQVVRSPFCYADGADGELTGMFIDICELIAEKSGLCFEYEALGVTVRGVDWLAQTDGRLVAGLMDSAVSSPSPELRLSEVAFPTSVVLVGRRGEAFDPDSEMTMAVPAAFIGGEEYVAKAYPNFDILSCEDMPDALDAIVSKKADVILQNIYVAREALQSVRYEGLEIFPAYEVYDNMKLGVAADEDPRFLSVINRTLAAVSPDEYNDIIMRYTVAKPYHITLSDTLYKLRVPLGIIAVLVIAVIALLVAFLIDRQRSLSRIMEKNAQLAEAVEQARLAGAAKGDFLARMSHEIRTPMNAIIGLTTLAKDHEDEPEAIADYLSKIDSASRLLLSIINDVLDMSSIESGKMMLAHTQFNISKLISSLTSVYYTQCEAKGIVFSVKLENMTDDVVVGDSLRLNQVLLNLLSNAVKFTERGSVTLRLGQRVVKEDKLFLHITVADTGCGMNADMLSRLFQPFEQENAETAKKHGGSGLGLAIVNNLVTLMGGAVDVQSRQGEGTVFTADIPFERCAQPDSEADASLDSLRVLAVDDDRDALSYVGAVLEKLGVEHDCASSGEQALSMMALAAEGHQPYNVCIIDWKMPGLNGLETTERIRAVYGRETMVIIASAYDYSVIDEQAKAVGVDYFVPKPLFPSAVYNTLISLPIIGRKAAAVPHRTYELAGRRVLLAEDNELNRIVAVGYLKKVGVVCDEAMDGKAALDMFLASESGHYDAILMDMEMPVMDGIAATREIRASRHPDAGSVPILAMTANAFTDDVARCLQSGMNDHIAKPIVLDAMLAALERTFRKEGPEDD